MTQTESQVPGPESFDVSSFVRDFGSYTAILAGIGYLSGFMVYQTYLGNAGIAPLGLLSVQYLVAGMLFVCAVAFAWVPAWMGEMLALSLSANSRKEGTSNTEVRVVRFLLRVFGTVSGWLIGGVVLYLIGVKVTYVIWWMLMAYVPQFLVRRRHQWAVRVENTWLSPKVQGAMFGFPLFAFVLVVLSGAFGVTIYPQIDRGVGGGRPVRLDLELTTVREPESGVYDVLAATDAQWIIRDTAATRYYIVSSDQVKVASLRGDAVDAVPRIGGKRNLRTR